MLTVIIGIAFVFSSACTIKPTQSSDDKAIKTVTPGVLTVGTSTPFPPFEEKKGDAFTGFDIDLARRIATLMGLRLRVVNVSWEGALPALRRGRFDMLAAAVSITAGRRREYDFSDSYITSNQSVMVRTGSPIHKVAHLRGKVVGVLIESTGQDAARGISGLKRLDTYDMMQDAFEDLVLGRLDAVIADSPVADWVSRRQKELSVAATIHTNERYALVVRKGNRPLLDALNAALARMRARGDYDRLCEKWFGKKL